MERTRYLILKSCKSQQNTFDTFVQECLDYSERFSTSVSELSKPMSVVGNIFECFCVLYLRYVKGYDDASILSDLLVHIRKQLRLPRNDKGIDIVAFKNGQYDAI
jgi:hypothetical protein